MKSVSTPDQYCKINDYICGSYRPNKIIATAKRDLLQGHRQDCKSEGLGRFYVYANNVPTKYNVRQYY